MVAVIIDQQLFKPVIQWVLAAEPDAQLALFYLANGLLSMVSDNVFVGTVYINEVKTALLNNAISREQFELLAVAINTGTNLPSVATPNGQAAFLFMLTSALAPLLRLSYGRMVWMALPYTWCWDWWVSSRWRCCSGRSPTGSIRLAGWCSTTSRRRRCPPCIDAIRAHAGPFLLAPALL